MSDSGKEKERSVSGRSLIAQIIYFILTIVLVLLLVRFILIFFGANQSNGFVDFIYSMSQPLVSPFYGIFKNNFVYGQGRDRFDFETIFAAIIYSIIATIAVKAISLGKRNVQP